MYSEYICTMHTKNANTRIA